MLKITKKLFKSILLLILSAVFIFIAVIVYEKNTRETINFSGVRYTNCWTKALSEIGSKCGLMAVPVSYTSENSDSRAFSFAILPSLNITSNMNKPLVYLIGGPGPAGTYYAEQFRKGAPGGFFRENRDVILVDYRGSGMSIPHDGCQAPSGLASVVSCMKSVYVADSDEHRSSIFARDINRLIEALEYESVILYGGSYGTRLALTMMRDTPEHISHVVIDGVFPVEVNGFSQGSRSILAGLAMISDRCEKEVNCYGKFGEIKAKIEKLHTQWSGRDDAGKLLSYLASYSYFPQAPILIDKLSKMSPNDSANLLIKIATSSVYSKQEKQATADQTSKVKSERDYSREQSIPMTLGIVCSEESAFSSRQPLNHTKHGFSQNLVNTVADISTGAPFSPSQAKVICGLLGINEAAPEMEIEAVKSDIPTLILSGGMDLQTSFEWGMLAKDNLSHSQHYILPFSDHMVMFDKDDCGRELIGQFIFDPKVKLNTQCLNKYPTEPLMLHSNDILGDFKHPYINLSE